MNGVSTQRELLPCPFCGGDRAFVQNAGWRANTFIRCPDCPSSFAVSKGERPHEDSVAAWNTRATPHPIATDLLRALETAKETIRAWHGPNAWEIYDRSSPEMQTINAALAKGEAVLSASIQQLRADAAFLIERLDDFERGSLSDTIEDACRDFDGHVSPAIERLRPALSNSERTDG